MLGFSGAGKTTYMAGMYSVMSRGIRDFSIHVPNSNHHEHLEALGKQLSRGSFPASTDIHQEYNFHLRYKGSTILPFDWYDYRGGALTSSTTSSPEVAELASRIKQADALIVFLDGKALLDSGRDTQRDCRRLSQLIQLALSERDGNAEFPISFVVTKGDIYGEQRLLNSPGFNAIRPTLELVGNNSTLRGLLTVTEINRQLKNTEYPFIFSMVFGLVGVVMRDAASLEANAKEYHRYANNVNIWDDIKCLFTDEPSWSDMARRKQSEVQRQHEALCAIIPHAENLFGIVKSAQTQDFLALF